MLVISSDLQEVIQIADRILVMSKFQIRDEFENNHDYVRMSRDVMRTIMGETRVAGQMQPPPNE